jgi:small subunit ribosomal protein S2
MTSAHPTPSKPVTDLFTVGAQYGYPKTRRHPSTQQYIFGTKNGIEIFDLEKTAAALESAVAAVKAVAQSGKKVLFVGGKKEAQAIVQAACLSAQAPFVAGRWVGGTLSNFSIIHKRVEKLLGLLDEKEKGTLAKYTKKERLMIDRDIKRLEEMFGGIRALSQIPGAVVIVDPKAEKIALAEAAALSIPVVALANSDCDLKKITYPIPANDASVATIAFVVEKLAAAYAEGAAAAPAKPAGIKQGVPEHEREAPRRRARTSR